MGTCVFPKSQEFGWNIALEENKYYHDSLGNYLGSQKMIMVPKKITAFTNYQWKESNFRQYVLSEVLTLYVLNDYDNIISYILIILQIWSGRVNCRHFWLQWRRRRIWSNYSIFQQHTFSLCFFSDKSTLSVNILYILF